MQHMGKFPTREKRPGTGTGILINYNTVSFPAVVFGRDDRQRSASGYMQMPDTGTCRNVGGPVFAATLAVRHSASFIWDQLSMRPLFRPSARAINWLLVVGFCSLGYALYLRYLAIEQSTVGIACNAGLDTWLCATRRLVATLFNKSVFGWVALLAAALNLLRPSLVLFSIALAAAGFGLVLYNTDLAALACGILILSLARPAPAPE